ncbi:MAG: biotin--[acetyl-CoA-carboxylase] ligase [Moraxellaceae bacterium]|nr:MAG: biotin--[acetyl-CoA-carboxylase] ligase [Moraxellaceae bacterium]
MTKPADSIPVTPDEQDPRVNALCYGLKLHGVSSLERIMWLSTTTSTNDMAKQGDTGAALVISNQQQAGRGQAGRSWQSPKGNLYLSLRWTLQHPVSGRLALEVALALVNMPILAHHAGLQIKWPNDLYFKDAKWGGILIEPLHDNQVVIGVGLNLQPMQVQVSDQQVTDLTAIIGQALDVTELAVQTTQALIQACQQFDHGSLELPVRFAGFDALMDRAVVIHSAAQPDIQGKMLGIQPDGALIVSTAEGTKIIYSGQVRAV